MRSRIGVLIALGLTVAIAAGPAATSALANTVASHTPRGSWARVANNLFDSAPVDVTGWPYLGVWGSEEGEGDDCLVVDHLHSPRPDAAYPNVLLQRPFPELSSSTFFHIPGSGPFAGDPTRCLQQTEDPQFIQWGGMRVDVNSSHVASFHWEDGGIAVRQGPSQQRTEVMACRLTEPTSFGITSPIGFANLVRNTISTYGQKGPCLDLTSYFEFDGIDSDTRPGTLTTRHRGIPLSAYPAELGLYEFCFRVWILHGNNHYDQLEDYTWAWMDRISLDTSILPPVRLPAHADDWSDPFKWDFVGNGGKDQHCV